ncbi:MAG: peptidyl-prolyl cis-trans isomerase [Sulfurospirillaceae bacterium]|nr:peptidyl-prolyl cis-trans isomerase [Sulfurospirillaceae bacterium]
MKKILSSVIFTTILSVSLNANVYATVNGEDVIDEDIQVLMKSMKETNFENLQADKKEKVINQAVERKLLTGEAIKNGIEKDQYYVDALKRIINNFSPEEWGKKEYPENLKKLKGDLALEVWMKKIYDDIHVDDKEVKDYYDKNTDKFIKPATVKAKHVLVKTEQEAKEVIKEIESLSGQKLSDKFTEIATIKMAGLGIQSNGDLGWFDKNKMVKPFSDVAFALKKGEMTKVPVQTQFGFHVILVEDKKDEEKPSYDNVKVMIENGLKMEKFRGIIANKAKVLRSNAKVIIH